MKPLLNLGLQDAARLSGKVQELTWDPDNNPLTQISARLALKRIHKNQGWEDKPHVFDRIYLRSRVPIKKVNVKRICDKPMLSDHYGVLAEITF
jgi:endonuclease/exonuclease/phosphatase family metal-dependent hydrolase